MIDLSSSDFLITDTAGNTKFTTQRRYPHIISTAIVNNFNIPAAGLTSTAGVEKYLILSAPYIQLQDSFVISFFRIRGGAADTAGTWTCGGGSIMLRILTESGSGTFAGSTIIDIRPTDRDPVTNSGSLILNIQQNNISDIYNDVNGNDAVSIDAKIYYGRFK
jgi:hypothetical protein